MKATIGDITYDTDDATFLANSCAASGEQRLYQMRSRQFFLVVLESYVDGVKLGLHEGWVEVGSARSRLQVKEHLLPLTCRQAVEWCVKTQIPATLRGYLLESF